MIRVARGWLWRALLVRTVRRLWTVRPLESKFGAVWCCQGGHTDRGSFRIVIVPADHHIHPHPRDSRHRGIPTSQDDV